MKFLVGTEVKAAERWMPSAHVTSAETDGKIAVIDNQESKVYHFNGAGAAIWKCVMKEIPFSELVLRVSLEYEAPYNQIAKDAARFLRQLREDDLIQPWKEEAHV